MVREERTTEFSMLGGKMKDLDKGTLFNYLQPMSDDFIKDMLMLMNGNTEDYTDVAFVVKNNKYIHYLCSCGKIETFLSDRYNHHNDDRIRKLTSACDCGNRIVVEEIEAGSNDFICIGEQLVVCYQDSDRIQIRIIPYGIKADDSMYIKTSDYAYFLSYDKHLNIISWNYEFLSDTNQLDTFSPKMEYFSPQYEDDYIGPGQYNYEEMIFGYCFTLVEKGCSRLYELLMPYIPTLQQLGNNEDIFETVDLIIRQIKYPIFSNPEAQKFLRFNFTYSDEFSSYLDDLRNKGFNPEKYGFKECFHIARNDVDGNSIEDILPAIEWNNMVHSHGLDGLISYYTDTVGKTLTAEDKYHLINYPAKEVGFVPYLKYIMRGATKEGIDVRLAISRTDTCLKKGLIKTWTGHYSETLWRKANVTNTTTLSLDFISNVENHATLDYLYKKLATT